MKNFRIGILCNNRMALPAIGQLLHARILCAVIVPALNNDLLQECRHMMAGSGIPVSAVEQARLTDTIRSWATEGIAQAVLLMTFPWRIPREALDAFPGKVFNFHYGLLPEMRGVDPVFESIRQQKPESGVTIHLATDKLDRGPIVYRKAIPLDVGTTHGLLCSRLGILAAQLCGETWLTGLASGRDPDVQAQDEAAAVYYGRPQLKDVTIDWNSMDSNKVHALVRACNPWNKGAYTAIKGWNIRICGFSFSEELHGGPALPAGTIVRADTKDGVEVLCNDGKMLRIDTVYTDEGIFDGKKLVQLGLRAGDRFTNIL